jgi:serine/threonine protein kinase/tetratricopeptide (TPR) repeat protein
MIGNTISHYKILEKLGSGGMGVVYRAEDTKLHRIVALKFLPPELTRDEDAKQRFIQEAQAASSLDHNNICVVHEIDKTDDGQLFICMNYYDGETLKKKIEKGPLKLNEAIDITIQIAQGLLKAHEKGIIHRDIKPANIFITKDGVVKILDFGLAKLSGQTMMTKIGSTVGTVAYMSPEQARGEEVDHRTDIWSLSVVLYEMISGQLPFKGEYEQAMIYSIFNEKPKPIKEIKTDTPVQIEKMIQKMLEKDINKRYQSFNEIISEMQTLPKVQTSNKNIKRKRSQILRIMGSIIITAIIVFVYFFILRKQDTDVIKSVAVLPFVDMSPQRDQEYFCDGITEDLINRLSKVQQLRVPARTSVFVFKGRTQDIKDIGEQLKVQAVLEGSVQKSGDRLRITAQLINIADGYHLWSEKYDRGLNDVFTIQDDISSAIVNALKLKLMQKEIEKISERPIDDVKAYDCYLKAERLILRYDEKSLDSAFVYLQTGIDIMGDNAELYAGMAYVYWQYTNMGIGQEEYLKLLEEYAKKALALKPDLSSALAMLGMLYCYEDYPKNIYESTHYFKKALESNPFEIRALTGMAITYAVIGKTSEADAFLDVMEHHDPLNPWQHSIRGYCYLYNCQFGPALEESNKYYLADSSSPMAQAQYSWALACSGKRDEALAVINRTGPGNVHNVQTIFYLLLKYALLKDRESALHALTPEFQKTCKRDAEWSYAVAVRLSLAGAVKEALDWLYNAFNRGFINYSLYQCDPFLNNIRGEERFKKLMEQVKYEWEHIEVPE